MTTVRLDAATHSVLKRLASQRAQTEAAVIHEAIMLLADSASEQPSALERLGPYLGIADSGGRRLSTDTGQRLRELLGGQRAPRSD